MSDQYYVRRAGKISGPAKAKLLEQYAANGKLQVTDEVATSPNGPWHAVSKVPLLANHLPAADELADPFGDPLAAASLLADGASVQPTSRPAKPQGRPSGKPSGGRAQRPGWLVPLLAGSGVVVVLLVAGAGFLLWRADESGLIGSWQGKERGPQGELEILWTFNEDGTGNMGFGALAPSMPFTWESAGADRVTITLAAPNGQSQKTIATWAVSGDTLTFTPEGAPEKLVLKRASAQSAPRHPEYLAHTWKSHPVLSNGLKQTAVFAKTGVLTLTTENGKPVQGTWEATGNQLTLSYPDTDSGELQTLVYQMTMGGADEEGTDTPISADLYLQGVGENKVSLMYTRPLHPEGQDGVSTEEANPSGEPGSMDGQTNVLSATPNNPQAKVDETAVQAAVAALKKLGAKIKRNDNGDVRHIAMYAIRPRARLKALPHLKTLTNLQELNLDHIKITDAGLAGLKGLTKLQSLSFHSAEVTDAGLVHFKEMPKLQRLSLGGCIQITDAGLVHLQDLTELTQLDLSNTKVTDAGIAELQQSLPNCKIKE